MASFECIGFISQIVYRPDSMFLILDEYHKGYKKNDGTIVDDKYVTFKVIYKPYFKKFISEHFSKGMLVKVKGEVFPYAIEHGEIKEGVSFIGETCNLYGFPRYNVKQENKMIKESQMHDTATPNLDEYNKPDF